MTSHRLAPVTSLGIIERRRTLAIAKLHPGVAVHVLVSHTLRVSPAFSQAQLEVVRHRRKQKVEAVRRLSQHIVQKRLLRQFRGHRLDQTSTLVDLVPTAIPTVTFSFARVNAHALLAFSCCNKSQPVFFSERGKERGKFSDQ